MVGGLCRGGKCTLIGSAGTGGSAMSWVFGSMELDVREEHEQESGAGRIWMDGISAVTRGYLPKWEVHTKSSCTSVHAGSARPGQASAASLATHLLLLHHCILHSYPTLSACHTHNPSSRPRRHVVLRPADLPLPTIRLPMGQFRAGRLALGARRVIVRQPVLEGVDGDIGVYPPA